MCSVTNYILLGASPVSTEVDLYDGTGGTITQEYTIALSTTTTYKCKATAAATPTTITETTVNIFKSG